MSGLLLILTVAEGDAFRAAIEVASTAAALGREVSVLIRGEAAGSFEEPAFKAVLSLMQELGVELLLCQTALAEFGLQAADVPDGVTPSGMVTAMQGRADWQLLLA